MIEPVIRTTGAILGSTAVEEMSNLGCQVALVVRGRAGRGTAYPTEDESFVYTELPFVVLEVLKPDRNAAIATGDTLTVLVPGGELIREGRRVIARAGALVPFRLGQEYLLVLSSRVEGSDAYTTMSVAWHLSGRSQAPVHVEHRTPHLSATSGDELLDVARKALASLPAHCTGR